MTVPSPESPFVRKNASQHFRDYLPAVLMAGVMIALTYRAGFYDDDSVISLWRQEMLRSGGSLWNYCLQNFLNFIHYQGRFPFVFSFGLLPPLVWIGDSLSLYRAYFAVIYLVSFLVIQYGLAKLLRDHRRASMVLICFVSGVQLQNYHDPYTSYFGYLPVLAALIVGALASFDRLIDSIENSSPDKKRLLALHLAWVAAAMLTWEVAIVIAAATAFQVLLLIRPWRARIVWMSIPVIWGALFVGVNLVLKRVSTNTGTLVEVSSPDMILHAYAVQLRSTVPLAAGDSYCPAAWQSFPQLEFGAIVGGLAILFLLWKLAGPSRNDSPRPPISPPRTATFALSGLCLIFIPPLLTAITAKYQRELQYGMGYLQVYVQNLGLAMVVGSALQWLSARRTLFRSWWEGAIYVCIAAIFVFHYSRNVHVITLRNALWQTPRELAVAALQSSGPHPDVAGIIVDRDYLQRWENVNFSQRYLGSPLPFKARSEPGPEPGVQPWLLLGYTSFASTRTPGFSYVGNWAGPEYSTSNTLTVLRPWRGATGLVLEYTIKNPDGRAEVRTVPVPPVQSGQPVLFTVSEPHPIRRGSVRVVNQL